ncbi:MAG: DUF1801 domain-containing protein [Hyphomonadaceae bacterium]|nr:DUF1801 domain-containing protein [Hyphomonadaceae bacterium]
MSISALTPDCPAPVRAVLDAYPPSAQALIGNIRALVFETAADLPEVGEVTETLKWGEPSYLNKAGTTIRLAWSAKRPDVIGLFVNCQTTLIDAWRTQYGDVLNCIGNREIRLPLDQPPPEAPLRHCIAMALTYHKRKSAR